MARGDIKRELFEQFARVGKAVASPARLELLELLAQGEKTVELLAEQAALTVKNASAHLRALRAASLVSTRKEGTYVFYRLADPTVHHFVRMLQDLARRRLAEADRIVRDYYEAPDALQPLSAQELLERMRAEGVVVLDVRPTDEFRSGHIPGAWSIPIDELEQRLGELPVDREVVAYCRGPYCVFALQAIELLRERGYRARRLEVGLPEWRGEGGPVAKEI